MNQSSTSRTIAAAVIVAAASLWLVACSSDSSPDESTTTVSPTTPTSATGEAATTRFDRSVQQQLADVGCHPGPVDGKLGPQTDAAIRAFQTAEGITVDGELGPQTEEALRTAVDAGTKICTSAPATTTTTANNTTTTHKPGGAAPCTAEALLQGLPAEGEHIGSYVCSGGYAAGTLSDGTTKFILQSENGQWFALGQDPCGSASAGLPAVILQDGCTA